MSESLKTKLMLQAVPHYTKGEEIFNWVSHLIGAVLGLFALILFITVGARFNYSPLSIASLVFYSLMLITLYSCSTIYHVITPTSPYKRVFRLVDHNTIYLLIVGSYAPICAIGFPGTNWGAIMMSVELVGLVLGMALNFISFNNNFVKVFTVILYVVMGWIAAICYPAFAMLNLNTMLLILFGGISYTVGVIFYAAGKSKKWMHSVFHLFVLVGSILQFLGILAMINLL